MVEATLPGPAQPSPADGSSPAARRSHHGPALHRLIAAAALITAACAPRATVAPATAADIPSLEAQLRGRPGAVAVMARLGEAYRAAGREEDARKVLEEAVRIDSTSAPAVFFLGLTYEDLSRYEDAGRLYARFVELGGAGPLRDDIAARVPLVHRRALDAAVRLALADEARLRSTPPQPRTIAVFPFRYVGTDAALEPLGRALAEMLVTDLATTQRLRVLERLRVQLLLDEIALGQGGRLDSATAPRAGFLLGAGHVVRGQIAGGEQSLTFSAAVVPVGGGRAPPVLGERDAARRFFAAEERIALGIFERLGVQLTPAERERIAHRPTENLQAILAYGLGLEAEDRGDFDEAARQFRRAVQLDPGFEDARRRAAASDQLGAASSTDIGALALRGDSRFFSGGGPGAGAAGGPGAATLDWWSRRIAFDDVERLLPAGLERDPAVELLGVEGLATTRALIQIILRRP